MDRAKVFAHDEVAVVQVINCSGVPCSVSRTQCDFSGEVAEGLLRIAGLNRQSGGTRRILIYWTLFFFLKCVARRAWV
jgi:hypothetical protein